jgi:arylsulfatase A-like enzyme
MHFCTDGAHSPYEPAESILDTPLRGRTGMTAHTDMVLETDILLGKLTAMLEQRGLLANTVVCFTSDNGGIPTDREYGHDAVGGLRGSKSEIWEGGHRVPMLVRWGDGTVENSRIRPGTVRHQVVGAHDLIATLLEFGGVRPGPEQVLDSVSLAPVLLGQRGDDLPVRHTLLVQSCPGRDAFDEAKWEPEAKWLPKILRPGNAPPRSVPASDGMAHALYDGHWKLVLNLADEPASLYDLNRDPGELSNLIGQPSQSARVRDMEAAYRAIRTSPRSAELSRATAP